MNNEAYVNLEVKEGVGYITFFHPSKNALPSYVLKLLEDAIKQADATKAIKVIVIKSAGDRVFCAGASLNELIAIENAKAGLKFFSGFAGVINAMRTSAKLIICRVQGKTVGGGLGIAAAADYCMATKFAAIKLSELSIGIGPFVIEPAVTRKIGKTAMAQMTIDAETFYTAQYAKEKGLYADVFEDTETLDQAVKTLANKLSNYNPDALQEMKRVFWENTAHWDSLLLERAKISGALVLSSFTKETLKRFK